jgi:hypothetical protein
VSGGAGLAVILDGEAMPPAEARAFWARFSAHMEEHKGDLAGFAKLEGFASVHPSMKDGAPVLLVSRSSVQRPYASVAKGEGSSPRGGSSDHPKKRRKR